MEKNLTLTGMMGVGKSTIGKNLAKELEYDFFDIDKLIELKEGSSISLIFKEKGEDYFRRLENDITLSKLKKKNCVISLGGGAFLNSTIRKMVKKSSISFWLDVSVNELTRRLKNSSHRPLLIKKNINESIKKIYFGRKKIYREADYKIKCGALKSKEIVNVILGLYEKSGN